MFQVSSGLIASAGIDDGFPGPVSRTFRRILAVTFLSAGLLIPGTAAESGEDSVSARTAGTTIPETTGDQESSESEIVRPEYVRIRRNDRRLAVALETSVITFTSASPDYPEATVDLIGAIHLGEPEYYQKLNELFKSYEVLLFEAVMPEKAVREGWRPGGSGSSGSGRKVLSDEQEWSDAKVGMAAIGVLQLGMKEALGMEFQLNGIDYTPDNFVHADMTAEEFESSMSKRGESFAGMLLKEMGKSMTAQQEQNPIAMNIDMMLSALSADRSFRIRRIAAAQIAKAGESEIFAGSDGTSTIITERNKKCLDVLQQQLRDGRRKIGIFYGAGHFSDMEKRLVEEHGFERAGEDWIVAWHLRAPEKNRDVSAEDGR